MGSTRIGAALGARQVKMRPVHVAVALTAVNLAIVLGGAGSVS